MSTSAAGDALSARRDETLEAIARNVRGTFQTVEDMTQSFIREAILRGVYRPGERLNQDSIATTLGVSRMPVRASLRQLEGEGLLRIHPHRGATVSVLRPDEIAEIYEMRVLLESYLLERAIPHLTDAVLAELRELVAELENETQLEARLEKRKLFYQRLYWLAQRPRAVAQVNALRASVGRYLLLQRLDEHTSHGGLIGFLEARDTAGAVSWLHQHLGHVCHELQQLVAAEENSVDTGA
jgi:DNA-binding GntR family transcriptional regulator